MSEMRAMPVEKQPCTLHKNHGSARPLRTVGHHIFPKEWGGDEHGVLLWTCDTGHYSVHRLLDYYRAQIEANPGEHWETVVARRPPFGGARAEIKMAQKGIWMWIAAGRPR